MPLDAARAGLRGQLITLLAAHNAALAARVAELEAANAELAGRVARLERAASRNSGNSSLPPSLDDQPGRLPPDRPKRGKGGKGGIARTSTGSTEYPHSLVQKRSLGSIWDP